VSGVLAVVTLGLYMGSVGRTKISPQVEHFLEEFWELLAFLGNTLVFVIAGVVIMYDLPTATATDVFILLVAYLVLHLIRVVLCFTAYFWNKKVMKLHVEIGDVLVTVWGGLRGAVGLALALVVFEDELICGPVKDKVMFHTAGTVMLTLAVNGTSMRHLLVLVGLDTVPASRLVVFN
ncbi:unnamed protein product, partial [Discosporangium mesarthrocarpum]